MNNHANNNCIALVSFRYTGSWPKIIYSHFGFLLSVAESLILSFKKEFILVANSNTSALILLSCTIIFLFLLYTKLL